MVRVLSHKGAKLPPTKRHGKVRHLLKDGYAIVALKSPFTIKLLYDETQEKPDPRVRQITG